MLALCKVETALYCNPGIHSTHPPTPTPQTHPANHSHHAQQNHAMCAAWNDQSSCTLTRTLASQAYPVALMVALMMAPTAQDMRPTQVGKGQWERVLEMVRRIRALDMEVPFPML